VRNKEAPLKNSDETVKEYNKNSKNEKGTPHRKNRETEALYK